MRSFGVLLCELNRCASQHIADETRVQANVDERYGCTRDTGVRPDICQNWFASQALLRRKLGELTRILLKLVVIEEDSRLVADWLVSQAQRENLETSYTSKPKRTLARTLSEHV